MKQTLVRAALILTVSLCTTAGAQSYAEQVSELVNIERWNNGQLPPLKANALLETAAATHSQNMATRAFFADCDLDTKTNPPDRMTTAGYAGFSDHGENISAGAGSPAGVMTAWMNSAGAPSNILSTVFREMGTGYAHDPGDQADVRFDNGSCSGLPTLFGPFTHYWTQDFGVVDDVYPLVIEREAYQTSTRAVDLYLYGTGWAEFMRFRNENTTVWSPWEVFNANKAWFLSQGDGFKTVEAQIQGPGFEIRTHSDSIVLSGSVVGLPDDAPSLVRLGAPSPNPTTGATRFTYQVRETGDVRLAVYDVSGRRVAVLHDGWSARGKNSISWDGTASDGTAVPSGLYFVRLDAAGHSRTTKLLITP